MKVNVCWYDERLLPSQVLGALQMLPKNEFLTQSLDCLEGAELFDETNHRWLITCRGEFTEAIRLSRDLMTFLRGSYLLGFDPYRLLEVSENDRCCEARPIESRLMHRIDSLENIIREQVQELKKSRKVAGDKVFQSIRNELERALRFDPHSW